MISLVFPLISLGVNDQLGGAWGAIGKLVVLAIEYKERVYSSGEITGDANQFLHSNNRISKYSLYF